METKRRNQTPREAADLQKKIDEQQRLIEELEKMVEEQDQTIKRLTSPSSASQIGNEISSIKQDISKLKSDRKQTEADVSALKGDRDEMMRAMKTVRQSQEQADSVMTVLKLDQKEIKKDNDEVRTWQRQAANFASERKDNHDGLKDELFEKVNKTKTLAKEVHQYVKAELKDRSRFYAEFSFTQTLDLLNRFPYKIEEYNKMNIKCTYFDNTTGVYTVPIKGKYRFTTKIVNWGAGTLQLHICDGTNRVQLGEVSKDESTENSFDCDCRTNGKLWLEVTSVDGRPCLSDCHFKAELLSDVDEDDNDDNDNDKNAAAAADNDDDDDDDDDNNAAEVLGKLLALGLLLKMQNS